MTIRSAIRVDREPDAASATGFAADIGRRRKFFSSPWESLSFDTSCFATDSRCRSLAQGSARIRRCDMAEGFGERGICQPFNDLSDPPSCEFEDSCLTLWA